MVSTLEVKGLGFAYGRDRALFDDLTVNIGDIDPRVMMLGPNGVGKSTLFKLIVGELTKRSGSIRVNGIELTRGNTPRIVGYMPQHVTPIRALTVAEQVTYAGWLAGLSTRVAKAQTPSLMELVGAWQRLGIKKQPPFGRSASTPGPGMCPCKRTADSAAG